MSRYILRSDQARLVSVGWEPQRGSYTATVLDRTRTGTEAVLLALGHKGSAPVTDPAIVLDAVGTHAQIPDGQLELLTRDATLRRVAPARPAIAEPPAFSHAEAAPASVARYAVPDAASHEAASARRAALGATRFSHLESTDSWDGWPVDDPAGGASPLPAFIPPDTSPDLLDIL
jgi:hypothetical protein